MVNWWRLARGALEADFPQHDLLHSFAVFDLNLGTDRSAAITAICLAEEDGTALETWADRLGLDPAALKAQFLQLRGLTAAFRKNCSNTLEAWQQAVFESQVNARRRANYPITELLPMLRRFAAYTGSTCGVERDISKFKRALGECRNFGPAGEERIAVLASRTHQPDEDIMLAKRARQIWAECFSAPRGQRRGNLPRIGQRSGSSGEAAAARVRRAALATSVAAAAAGAGRHADADTATAAGAIRKAAAMWATLQAKELIKRHILAKKRRLDAILHGTCAPGDSDDVAEVAQRAHQLRQKQRELLRKYAAEKASPRDPRLELRAGTRVFIDPSLLCRRDILIQEAITKLRWRQVDDRVMAQVLVVPDPARPGPKNAFVAALGGRLLVSMGFLTGGERHVVATRYARALGLPRYLWVSPACELKFAASLQVMRRMLQQCGVGDEPRSRWG